MPDILVDSRDGVARQRVAHIQRARILSATLDACSEQGAANVTVADVVGRAGISRRTFYELFDDCEECLLAALDDAIERASELVLDAYEAHASWRERIRAGLTALLRFLDEEHSPGRLLIVDSLAAGPAAVERRSRVLDAVQEAIEEGLKDATAYEGRSHLTAEGIVGGVLSVIHTRMVKDNRPLTELVNPLMSMIVLPYLGPAAARKESERPVIVPARASRPKLNPFSELDMRLTYRTMRVLSAIAEQPGGSNRQVGRVAGVEDQGQVSKLLARLQRIGLIENTEAGGSKGTPNAWVLTRKGAEVERTIAAHSGSFAG
jgi:AcrR family transcriptional regulator/DNA-binding MarR family transcriptional regulator